MIHEMLRKASIRFNKLNINANSLNCNLITHITRMNLVQAVVVPILIYGDIVYHPGLTASLKDQLLRCQVRREICLQTLVLEHDLPSNYTLRTCSFMRQAYYGDQPDYILQHFQRGQQERARCSIIPRHTTSSGKSLLVFGASCWNGVSLTIEQKPTLISFKKVL